MTIAQGTFNGVNWRSLTHIHEARAKILEHELNKYNRYRKEIGLLPMGHADYLVHRYHTTLSEYINQPLTIDERRRFRLINSRYLNNYVVHNE